MKLTKEQIETLSQWEYNFNCAVKADWTSNPGRAGLQVIYDIFTQATGDTRRLNDNCSHCILELVRDCGKLYFHDKEELINKENDARMVELSLEAAKTAPKVSVKTKKSTKKVKE